MPSSQSGTPSSPPDDSELEDLIAQLSVDPEREPIASEIGGARSLSRLRMQGPHTVFHYASSPPVDLRRSRGLRLAPAVSGL